MIEFIDYATKMGKVKSLNEVDWNCSSFSFSFIQESSILYNNFIIGDLVLVQKYKYKNGNNRVLSYISDC